MLHKRVLSVEIIPARRRVSKEALGKPRNDWLWPFKFLGDCDKSEENESLRYPFDSNISFTTGSTRVVGRIDSIPDTTTEHGGGTSQTLERKLDFFSDL